MDDSSCGVCGKFTGCCVGHTREREGRDPCLEWVPATFEQQTGAKIMSGREFFERYGIPAADLQGKGGRHEG